MLHVDVPNHDSLVSRIRKRTSRSEYGFIQPPYHMLAYTPTTLRQALVRAGLADIDVRSYSNDDPVWRQLVYHTTLAIRLAYAAAKLTGMGSLLTATPRT